MREYPNPGFPPARWPKDTPLRIRWKNGNLSPYTFTASMLRWTHTGFDFDVGHFSRG